MHLIVYGLGFGDEGKGATVDFLSSQIDFDFCVRYSGGAQAGHNVILDDGTHHTFKQFGAATFNLVPTFMTETTAFDPHSFLKERGRLKDAGVNAPETLMFVHPEALLVTPMHIEANRIRNEMLNHGSVGMGVGEAFASERHFKGETTNFSPPSSFSLEPLRVRELRSPRALLKSRLAQVETYYYAMTGKRFDLDMITTMFSQVGEMIYIGNLWGDVNAGGQSIFEGSQGILLDEAIGYFPHVTWGRLGPQGVTKRLEGKHKRIGVTRSYMTRHGNGPFPSESKHMNFLEPHNHDFGMQGKFRQGYMDLTLLDYAIKESGADLVSVTHLDRPVTCGYSEGFDSDPLDFKSDTGSNVLGFLKSKAFILRNGPARRQAEFTEALTRL